jgi:CBS domain-containing protein
MLFCRDELRSARAMALADAEGFISVVHALELVGQLKSNMIMNGLGGYTEPLTVIARLSTLASDIPGALPQYHSTFDALFPVLCRARNDAVHQGVYARTLTEHAVEVSLILEDALMADASDVSHFMVRNVVEAKPWHSVSYVRQTMLKNAFSYLPLWHEETWWLIPDYLLARHIRAALNREDRINRLSTKISDIARHAMELPSAVCVEPKLSISGAVNKISESPLLVVDPHQKDTLLGLITASDIL